MFGWLRNHRHCKNHGKCRRHIHRDHTCLTEGQESNEYIILCNNNRKTIEMGMYNGAVIKVLKNHPSENSIVVGVNDSRFILSKLLAESIMIKSIGSGNE
eukprot:Anaeramoba_ignava/a482220_6.p1 GENE.a482220_6~~a482220_6.p1  ORF type:complete len:100 (-),score=0.98 a482220_6:309-608(-)